MARTRSPSSPRSAKRCSSKASQNPTAARVLQGAMQMQGPRRRPVEARPRPRADGEAPRAAREAAREARVQRSGRARRRRRRSRAEEDRYAEASQGRGTRSAPGTSSNVGGRRADLLALDLDRQVLGRVDLDARAAHDLDLRVVHVLPL